MDIKGGIRIVTTEVKEMALAQEVAPDGGGVLDSARLSCCPPWEAVISEPQMKLTQAWEDMKKSDGDGARLALQRHYHRAKLHGHQLKLELLVLQLGRVSMRKGRWPACQANSFGHSRQIPLGCLSRLTSQLTNMLCAYTTPTAVLKVR